MGVRVPSPSILLLVAALCCCSHGVTLARMGRGRPPPDKRLFVSPLVDRFIDEMHPRFRDADLALIWETTLPNALDTTFRVAGPNDTFVITGDIDAMWLRDSAFQVAPYLRLLKERENEEDPLRGALCGLVMRHARSILIDGYANAFNFDASSPGPHQHDQRTPAMTSSVFEGKYELDSLTSFLWLSNELSAIGENDCLKHDIWMKAIAKVIDIFTTGVASRSPYRFERSEFDMQALGFGPRGKRGTGLIPSGFRPSDDPCAFPFHVPR